MLNFRDLLTIILGLKCPLDSMGICIEIYGKRYPFLVELDGEQVVFKIQTEQE